LADRARALGQENIALRLHAAGVKAYENGDYEGAERFFSRQLQINPQDSSAHYNLGRARQALPRPDFAGAVDSFKEAVRLSPTAQNYEALGVAHLNMENFKEAETALAKGLSAARQAEDAPAVTRIDGKLSALRADNARRNGVNLLEQGQAADALVQFREAENQLLKVQQLTSADAEAQQVRGQAGQGSLEFHPLE
jgi:tetratricopeptide (TPR) repeat protein